MNKVKKKIKDFLKSGKKELVFKQYGSSYKSKLPDISPETMVQTFMRAGGELDDDYDTNGWELDYWQKGTYKGRRYMLSGSGWYGLAKIELITEEDDA